MVLPGLDWSWENLPVSPRPAPPTWPTLGRSWWNLPVPRDPLHRSRLRRDRRCAPPLLASHAVAEIRPFQAVRYDEERAGPITSLLALPYDVIGPVERERYLDANPYNVVRLIVPDSAEDAARLFSDWQREGVLVQEEQDAIWWLRQDYEGPDGVRRTRQGLVASLRVEPYEAGVIRPHERTYPEPKRSQLQLLRAVRASLSPILLLYDDPDCRPRKALEPLAVGEPVFEAVDGSSVNRLWRVTDEEAVREAVEALRGHSLVIADGHHRYETALAFQEEDGSEASAYTMAVLANTHGEGLTIFPTHRVYNELSTNGDFPVKRPFPAPLEALRELEQLPREHPAFVLYERGGTWIVEAPGERVVDTAVLDRLATDGVRYTPRAEEAVALVDAGDAQAACLLRAPTIEQVTATARAGETMPQKSTYFYPKLLSGLLFHKI
jgi:uncharacterized protein (DUF1015 family)